MKLTARKILERLAESAYWCGQLWPHLMSKEGPGVFMKRRTTSEEKEILKELKAEDTQNFRPYGK